MRTTLHAEELIRRLDRLDPGPACGAEVGVSRGQTSTALLRHFPRLMLYMVDAWATYPVEAGYRASGDAHAALSQQAQERHARLAQTRTAFAGDRRAILRMDSLAAAAVIPDRRLDFAFLDADHTYAGVVADLAAWWPKIRSGGLLCGHDYGHPRDRRGLFGVQQAVDEFAAEHGLIVEAGPETVWSVLRP